MTAVLEAPSRVQLYIGGAFVDATDTGDLLKTNPATGEPLVRVPDLSPQIVSDAAAAARAAFDGGPWRELRPADREACLHSVADLLEENADDVARLDAEESGIPLSMTRGGHVPRAVAYLRHFAAEAVRINGESYNCDDAYQHFTAREPIGVVAILTPWNATLSVATINMAAALACGNTCVIKPSELAPRTAMALARILDAAEVPPGVVNVIAGGPTAGRALVSNPDVDVISFTGGTGTAREIMRDASARLKRLGFELGGKSPSIVFADATFDDAVDASLLSVFSSNGEVCTAASRILVQRPLYERFVEVFALRTAAIRVGDPLSPQTEVGPLISADHRERVRSMITAAVAEGATLVTGGDVPAESRGYYLRPAVLANVTQSMRISHEEVFGPVAAILPFDDEEEAVAMANDSDYGLAAYIWTNDVERALRVGRAVHAGSVAINSPLIRDLRAPFGGYKQSGIGRVGGRASIELFTEVKTTSLPVRPYRFPRLGTQ